MTFQTMLIIVGVGLGVGGGLVGIGLMFRQVRT